MITAAMTAHAAALVTSASAAAVEATMGARALEFITARYDFALWCALGSVLVGLCGGLLGSFLVLRRMSLMGDVLSHAMLPGVVAAFMVVEARLLLPLYGGALTSGLLAALAFGFIVRHGRTRPDAALALVLTTFFGLGIVLLSHVQANPSGDQAGLAGFLFGNAITVTPAEVGALAVITVASLIAVVVAYKPLVLLSFDPVFARSLGYRTGLIHYGLMALTSLAIVASIQAVGVVLVVAMLITPAVTARLLTRRLPWMLALSALLGAISGYTGALLSYLFEGWSSGPTMVLVASALFTLAALFSPRRGAIIRWLRRRRQRDAAPRLNHARPDPDPERELQHV